MSHRTTGSTGGVGAVDGGPLTAVGGISLIINVVGLYAFTGVALCVFGYIALTFLLSLRAGRLTKNSGSAEAGNIVLVLSWLVALVGGALVGAFHWVQYAHAAYAVLGVYASAVLIWLIGRAFNALWSWLFPLAGFAMLAAVVQLGSPPGADDMEEKESWTPVNVTAVDEAGEPIDGATVYLDLVQFWQGDPDLDEERQWWSKGTTQSDGTARMALHEDPRFKRLLIRVRREPFAGGYNEPTTIGGCVGYEDARLQTFLPESKAPYAFQVAMNRRAHPDSALLAIELQTPATTEDVVARSIKLALTTEPELPWYESGRTFNEDAVVHGGQVRDLFVRGSQRLVFRLGRDLAGRSLTLHALERDPSRYDDAYRELRKSRIAPIPLGDELTLPLLTLPGGTSSANSPTIAEGIRESDRR